MDTHKYKLMDKYTHAEEYIAEANPLGKRHLFVAFFFWLIEQYKH